VRSSGSQVQGISAPQEGIGWSRPEHRFDDLEFIIVRNNQPNMPVPYLVKKLLVKLAQKFVAGGFLPPLAQHDCRKLGPRDLGGIYTVDTVQQTFDFGMTCFR